MSRFFQDFLDRVRKTPSAVAVCHPGASRRATKYAELLKLTEQYAVAFSRVLPPGMFVPIFANKSAEAIACSLACLASGRPFAWLNKRLRGPQLAEIIRAGNTEFIVVDAPGLVVLRNAIIESPELARVRWLGLADTTTVGNESALSAAGRLLPEGVSFEALELKDYDGRTTLGGMNAEAWACCLFTSGSTGRQKGVMVREGDLCDRAASEAVWFGLGPQDRLLSILPFSFDVGLNQLMSALITGACLVLQESWLPKDILGAIAKEKVTGISGVPAIWRDFLSAGLCQELQKSHSSLRYVTISGGSLSVPEQAHFRAGAAGIDIFKTYGQTETFRSASLRPEEFPGREDSVGRAYPGTRVFILDDWQRPCAPGEVGEIVHVGAGTMKGYLGENLPEDKLRKLPELLGGALAVFTGDYGYLDREGYLFLKGRRDGMIKIAGNRVYPEEVTHHIRAIDGVREAEVVAVKTESGDSSLVAFVIVKDRTATTSDAIRRAATRRLPAHMAPAKIVFLDTIPRLPNGKPDQAMLRASVSGACFRTIY
ncbi:MAG TPA: AMP-binding protein [Methylomirabilota bacterium]|nr:AMP-binding protein [Methylomirabilota bacterium]